MERSIGPSVGRSFGGLIGRLLSLSFVYSMLCSFVRSPCRSQCLLVDRTKKNDKNEKLTSQIAMSDYDVTC